ncbi:hypothetical protein ACCQ05_12390 [Xanthomonas sp. NCPPB 3582]|uniref:hypothetical protein n=1 Tax=Xanthomonas sp. NCPPB 3582 TaxID=487557 RepID=UPI003556A884
MPLAHRLLDLRRQHRRTVQCGLQIAHHVLIDGARLTGPVLPGLMGKVDAHSLQPDHRLQIAARCAAAGLEARNRNRHNTCGLVVTTGQVGRTTRHLQRKALELARRSLLVKPCSIRAYYRTQLRLLRQRGAWLRDKMRQGGFELRIWISHVVTPLGRLTAV